MVTLSLIKHLFAIHCSTYRRKRKANKKKKPPVTGRQIGLIISLNFINILFYYYITKPFPPANSTCQIFKRIRIKKIVMDDMKYF